MKKLNYALLILLSISYSCNSKTKNTTKETVIASPSSSEIDIADKPKIVMTEPTKEAIIIALEKAIDFCKNADKEAFRKYLGASKEQINSVSDEEFIEIKEDNAYLYKNLITALRNDEATFKILSNENDIFKISFIEKGSNSMAVLMDFSYNQERVLALDSLNER